MDKTTHPYFVPDSLQGNRRDTAILLTGTATEGDSEGSIPQREVAATQGGFRISERVYKALGWDEDDVEDEVGDADARVVPGEVVTGQVPVSPVDTEVPSEDEADADEEPEEGSVAPYAEWDYADLRAEVTRRGIDTVDLKGPTLVEALEEDDATVSSDDDADDNA